jgi:rhodanese-related sulfurtransferase
VDFFSRYRHAAGGQAVGRKQELILVNLPDTFRMRRGAAALLLAGLPALAVMAQAQGLPQALVGVKQADGVCKNDSPNKTPAAADTTALDAACTLTVAGWDAFMARPGALVMDTRTEAQYAEFHAPGALRMDASSIRYKSYLRSKPLLLTGNGKGDRELYERCAQLRAQGFPNVQVAVGGMAAYVVAGKPVLGRVPAAVEMARLDPSQLVQEAYFPQNMVVMLGSSAASEYVPYAIGLNDSKPEALTALVEKRRKESKAAVASVVLVLSRPLSEEQHRSYLQAVKPSSLLFYGDSVEMLAKYTATQKAVWAAHARGPKQPRCG